MDRTTRQLGYLAPVIGVALTLIGFGVVVLGVVDPFADISSEEYLGHIADRPGVWLAAHLVIALAVLLKLGAFLVAALLDRSDRRGWSLAAAVLATCGALLLVITMVRDGYVHGYLAEQWSAADGTQRQFWADTFAGSLRTSYGTELLSLICLLGLAPAALSWGRRQSGTLPRWLCVAGLVQGAGALVTAGVLWMGGPSEFGYGALYPLFGVALPNVWLLGLAWSMRRPAPRAATDAELPVPASAVGWAR